MGCGRAGKMGGVRRREKKEWEGEKEEGRRGSK